MASNDNLFAVVLPAGGLGLRMGGQIPKQLLPLKGKPVYRHSLDTFLSLKEISEVVLAVPQDWKEHFENEILNSNISTEWKNKLKIVVGGKERWQSVRNGVEAITSNAKYVLVHDVARPFISKELLTQIFETLVSKGSCIVAKECADTVKVVTNGKIEKTLDRNSIWLAQTPQCASVELLKNLYQKIDEVPLDFLPTDEASILEYFGEQIFIVKGNSLNDKLTTPEDFERFSNLKF